MIDEERYQDEVHDGGEDNRQRRESSISFAVENGTLRHKPTGSRGDSSPRTPPPLLSHTSTTSSNAAESAFHENPWQASQDRPRPLESTISSPLLPSQAQRSNPPATPRTPREHRLSSSKAGRPSTLSRGSMARLTPGPLISPLSSSLTAVVADNLRKGLDSPTTRRRPGPGLRQSRSQRATRSSTVGDDAVSPSLPNATRSPLEDTRREDRPANTGRAQSVGTTLGEFFRLKRERSRGKGNDQETDDTQQS